MNSNAFYRKQMNKWITSSKILHPYICEEKVISIREKRRKNCLQLQSPSSEEEKLLVPRIPSLLSWDIIRNGHIYYGLVWIGYFRHIQEYISAPLMFNYCSLHWTRGNKTALIKMSYSFKFTWKYKILNNFQISYA